VPISVVGMAVTSYRLTVGELGRMVGMSPRNIRAHQARQLLPPPVRQGRAAYYHAEHVHRLEAIKALQRQGFNLIAVRAILGAKEPEPDGEQLAEVLQRLARDRPDLVCALGRYGVVTPDLRVIRPRVLRSALHLRRGGVEPGAAVELLVEVLGQVHDLLNSANRRATASATHPNPAVLADAIAGLLAESFRAAVARR
jgi:DNA-binding transcriptional MerR regulator